MRATGGRRPVVPTRSNCTLLGAGRTRHRQIQFMSILALPGIRGFLRAWRTSPFNTASKHARARVPASRIPLLRRRPASLGGAAVHLAFGQRRELLVGRLFLVEILLEQACAVVVTELFRP